MIPLYKPYMPDSLPELNDIIHSGALSYGKWGQLFEERLSRYIGNNKVAVVNSFNSAMLVALTAIGIKPGEEVIASPMSCLASNQPFVTQNAKVVWADIDPSKGTLDPDSVRKKITSKTKAIFHNHFCGYIGYVDEINKIAKENGIVVVDDGIEAFGAEYKGRKMGNWETDITVFSFQTVRLPNTIDGGALVFTNNELYEKSLIARDYGINRKTFRDSISEISPDTDISLAGFGAMISEINSYVGVQQMNHIEALLKKQQENASAWSSYFKEFSVQCIPLNHVKNSKPNFWIFGILADRKYETIINFREKGYYASGVHLNNNHYSVFRDKSALQGVKEFSNKFVALPSGWWFNKSDL